MTKKNKYQTDRVMIGIDRYLYLGLKEVVLHEIKKNNGEYISIKEYVENLIKKHLRNKEYKENLVLLYERKK